MTIWLAQNNPLENQTILVSFKLMNFTKQFSYANNLLKIATKLYKIPFLQIVGNDLFYQSKKRVSILIAEVLNAITQNYWKINLKCLNKLEIITNFLIFFCYSSIFKQPCLKVLFFNLIFCINFFISFSFFPRVSSHLMMVAASLVTKSFSRWLMTILFIPFGP